MSHEWESGFVVREQAWHGLATVLDAPPTTAEGLRLAGLDWRVRMSPLWTGNGMKVLDLPGSGSGLVLDGPFTSVESHRAVVRDTDESILGVVGADYVPVQNADAMAFFDPLIARGDVELESAGSLKGGKRVWVLAKVKVPMDGVFVAADDPVLPYLLVSTAHDGTRAVTVCFTVIRVVCWNTLRAAEGLSDRGKGASLRIRHIGNPVEALAEVSAFVDVSRQTFAASLDEWRAMRAKGMDVRGLERYIVRVLREEDDREIIEAELGAANRALLGLWPEEEGKRVALLERIGELRAKLESKPRALDEITRLFEEGPGASLAGPTVWGAFNAITHWVDHIRGRTADSRLDASWFGVGAQTRARARSEALALVGGV